MVTLRNGAGLLRRFQPFFSGKNLRLCIKFLSYAEPSLLPEKILNFKRRRKKPFLPCVSSFLSSLFLISSFLFFIIIINYYFVNDDDDDDDEEIID